MYFNTNNKQSKNKINKNFTYNTIKKNSLKRYDKKITDHMDMHKNGIKSSGRFTPKNTIVIQHREINQWNYYRKNYRGKTIKSSP